jgi:hypothetical protein
VATFQFWAAFVIFSRVEALLMQVAALRAPDGVMISLVEANGNDT